jgi:hypothetical protein
MKDPNYPSSQPKNPVDDALVDRNSDPDAMVESEPPLKKHGDALLDGSGSRQGEGQSSGQGVERSDG